MNDKKTWEERYKDWEKEHHEETGFYPIAKNIASLISSVEAAAYRRGLNRAVEYIKAVGTPGCSTSPFGPDIDYYKVAVPSLELSRSLPDEGLDNKSV